MGDHVHLGSADKSARKLDKMKFWLKLDGWSPRALERC